MGEVAIKILMFLRSGPGTARCVGAVAYFGRTALFATGFHQPFLGSQEGVAQPHPSRRLGTSPRRSSAAIAFAFLVALAVFVALNFVRLSPAHDCLVVSKNDVEQTTSGLVNADWRTEDKRDWMAPVKPSLEEPHNETSEVPFAPKAKILARVHAAIKINQEPPVLQHTSDTCMWWSPNDVSQQPPAELHTKFRCLRRLMEDSVGSPEEATAVLSRSRQAFDAIRAFSKEVGKFWNSSKVEWAHITHSALQLHCSHVTRKLQEMRQAKASPETSLQALSALRSLKALERPFREARAAFEQGIGVVRHHAGTEAKEQLVQFQSAHGVVRSCLVGAVREARFLASALPQHCTHMKTALKCEPDMLVNVEALAIFEIDGELDPTTRFNLGLYWSDLETNGRESPFFVFHRRGEGDWALDAQGSYVPDNIAKAEKLLYEGQQYSVGADQEERAAVRALRLYQHAKHLALKHHDEAAEWRFHAAAELAAVSKRHKLAAHSLARLSYFIMLRGRQRDALSLAGRALAHTHDPLAQYIQVTLRRSLGELRTDDDLRVAEKELRTVANKLPSKGLEDQRAAASAELALWRSAAYGGIRQCYALVDVARVLVCIFCKFAFR